jgi:hypothetical protein
MLFSIFKCINLQYNSKANNLTSSPSKSYLLALWKYILNSWWQNGIKMKLKLKLIYDWVSWPICLGVRHPSGTRDQFFFFLEISFGQLQACYFVVPFLMRGRVSNLLYNCFWALPEQPLLGQSPAELMVIFYCLIWDSPNLEGQVPVFISPMNRVAQLYTRVLDSLFVASYDTRRATVRSFWHVAEWKLIKMSENILTYKW